MKTSCTAERLKYIMQSRNIRQVDILNLCKPYCVNYNVKMNKSDLSQYLSGKTEPNQDKLVILSMALNLNEAWLMGYDVPMEKTEKISSLNEYFERIVNLLNSLNMFGKEEAEKRIEELTHLKKYTKDETDMKPTTVTDEISITKEEAEAAYIKSRSKDVRKMALFASNSIEGKIAVKEA